MSRLSREQKRELKRQRSAGGTGGQPTTGMTPIEVHVPASADAAGPAVRGAAGARSGATVGGVPVVPAPGETVQGAILNHLHRLALATGHPVLATIHDERIGFVVPLQVHVDGSSRYTGEPERVAPPAPPAPPMRRPDGHPHLPAQEHRHSPAEGRSQPAARNFSQPPAQDHHPRPPAQERPQPPGLEDPRPSAQDHPRSGVEERPYFPVQERPQPPAQRRPESPAPPLPPAPVSAEGSAQAPETPVAPRRDKATYALRSVPEPHARPAPGPESGTPSAPARRPETAPAPAPAPEPALPPKSAPPAPPEFAPAPQPAPARMREPAVTAEFVPQPQPQPQPASVASPEFAPEPQLAPARSPGPAVTAEFVPQVAPEPPARPEFAPEPQPAPLPPRESAPATAPAAMPEPVVEADSGQVAGAGAGSASSAVAPASGPEPVPAGGPAAPGAPTPSTFALRAVPEPKPLPGAASTHVLRAAPESTPTATSAPTPTPMGKFGPAPLIGSVLESKPAPGWMAAHESQAAAGERKPEPESTAAAPARKPASAMEALSLLAPEREPEPKPAPVRGFDAVAEAVLAPSPQEPGPERDPASAFLAEPVARINEAVKMGRIESAAGMAERAVAEAAQSLGQEHPEVLKLRELTAYIAYLAGDALRSFHLSLDLARVRRRHRDTGAAYGNVQSAATAWRAVRDPLQGLHLGRDLIGVWTELTADDGPAADDLEQLESARTRMGRLADRAHVVVDNPYTWTPRAHGE
ncbi:hypothetical protein [Streptomyces sp. NPDC005784]|uniref:hypothetical protein n=1 Tax=Streptomyces sp. NPDC005784 TaxID=3364731 RepID=UPI0036832F92